MKARDSDPLRCHWCNAPITWRPYRAPSAVLGDPGAPYCARHCWESHLLMCGKGEE